MRKAGTSAVALHAQNSQILEGFWKDEIIKYQIS